MEVVPAASQEGHHFMQLFQTNKAHKVLFQVPQLSCSQDPVCILRLTPTRDLPALAQSWAASLSLPHNIHLKCMPLCKRPSHRVRNTLNI